MKKKLFYFSIGIIIEISTSFFRMIDFNFAGTLAFLLYIVAFLYFLTLKKTNSRNVILLAFLTSFILLNFVPRIFYFNRSLISLPYCFFNLLGIVLGYILTGIHTSKISKSIFSVSFVLLISIFYIKGSSLWIHYLNFNTFTGYIKPYKIDGLKMQTVEGIFISNDQLNRKIVLLDFWTTSCGACFEKFPELEAFYKQSKEDSSIAIIAVNSPLQRDSASQFQDMISKYNYTFPTAKLIDTNFLKKNQIEFYPTVVVINKEGYIVYRGTLNSAIKKVQELTF